MYHHSVKCIQEACNCLDMPYPIYIRKTTKGYILQWGATIPFIESVGGEAQAQNAVSKLRNDCNMSARLSPNGNLLVPHQ